MAQFPVVILQWEAAQNKKKLCKIEVDITTDHAWGLLLILASLLPCCRRRKVRLKPQNTCNPVWVSKTGQVFHKEETCPGLNAADKKQVRELRACSFCYWTKINAHQQHHGTCSTARGRRIKTVLTPPLLFSRFVQKMLHIVHKTTRLNRLISKPLAPTATLNKYLLLAR